MHALRPSALLLAAALAPFAAAADIKVPGDFATIQQAVTAAAPGDVVIVGSGTYAEAVVVAFKTDVTIRSQKPGGATISGVTTAFDVADSTGVVIRGFDIDTTSNVGVLIESSSEGCTLDDLEIVGANGGGISVEGVGHVIDDCKVSDSGLSGISLIGTGTIVRDCDVENVAFDGYLILGTQHLLTDSKASDCGNNGVQLGNGVNPTGRCLITGCDFSGGLSTAVLVSGAFDSVVRRNKIKSPGGDGVRLNSAADGIVVMDNRIQKVTGTGVFVGSAIANVIDNIIQKPGGNGIQMAAASQPARIVGNRVAGAAGDGLRVESSGSIIAENRASKSKGFDLADTAGDNTYVDNKLKTIQPDE